MKQKFPGKLRNSAFFAVLLAFTALFTSFAPVIAAGPTNQGLTISPFLLERQINRGETLNEVIEVTNNSNQTLPIDITVNDFIPKGDNGQQQFLDPGQADPKFSLASWIRVLNSPILVLGPGKKTDINFTITPPANAEDGGHYGAILFAFKGAQTGGSAVEITQKVGSIILVKLGKVNESTEITKFTTSQTFYDHPPVIFLTRFNNTGNIHTKPRGGITITNMFGKKVGTALVNENANNVLPASERQFESIWNDKFAFGMYTADEKIVYGDSGTVLTAKTTFWVIPVKLTLGIALGLFILIVGFVYGLRAYNRWLLNKVYGKRK